MVMFKRKPVQYVPKPPLFEDQEIWAIEETNEIFTNYDDYLARMDFYNQKRFISEITGASQLTFFDALIRETDASNQVEDTFPDSLKEPILRKVQFSQISRIDMLVDRVFEEFKNDFYPGERVTVILDNGDRWTGVIREKTKFPALHNLDGTLHRKSFSRYFVTLTENEESEALVDDDHVMRERKHFTKQMVRSFLKNTLQREAWAGAPWLVKELYAHQYRISTLVPDYLRYDHQVAQRKANNISKKGPFDGPILNFFGGQNRLPELKPKSHKSKHSQQDTRSRQDQFLDYQRTMPNDGVVQFPRGTLPSVSEAQFLQFINPTPAFPAIAAKGVPKPPPPPPVKYPIEDLELPPVRDVPRRPAMAYLSEELPVGVGSEVSSGLGSGILMESVGPILETWDTLNVYCEVFLIDSFTFDDYVEALQLTSEAVPCELLAEIHCAVLKRIINDEKDLNGQIQVVLPVAPHGDSEDDDSTLDGSTKVSPEPANKRTTRSSIAKSEAAELKAAATQEAKQHRAAEIDQSTKGYDWRSRLRKRDLKNGKWIVVIVGLLNLLAVNPRLRKDCDQILAKLAPLDMDPTEDTAVSQYACLDVNLRVKILQMLCMLSLETPAIRGYMEDCTSQMTQFRKEKIDQQRLRKATMEELKILHEERKVLQPEDASPVPELEDLEELEELKVDDAEEDEDVVMEDSEDQEPIRGRSLRRANDRAIERKKKIEAERERKEKAEAEKAKKPSKEARKLEKILHKIEDAKERIKACEDEMATLENDLRESDCPRTRVLGKDRFWNRYYWMERNAMPYAGLPTSSTADAGYANGCLWVQGPDDLERQGFIELTAEENAHYKRAFHVTVPERKVMEEGPTHTFTAHEWGFYDDPDQLDKLIAWLDMRGVREVKLRKELQAQRENISTHMESRKKYLANAEDKKSESEEPVSRISTRATAHIDPTGHRCLMWKNTTALKELGHLHSNPTPRKAQTARTSKKAAAAAAAAAMVEDEGRQTRASNRQGKPLSRQGARYDF